MPTNCAQLSGLRVINCSVVGCDFIQPQTDCPSEVADQAVARHTLIAIAAPACGHVKSRFFRSRGVSG